MHIKKQLLECIQKCRARGSNLTPLPLFIHNELPINRMFSTYRNLSYKKYQITGFSIQLEGI